MMRLFFFVVLPLLFFSCGSKSSVSKRLKGCDSLVITFNASNSDSAIKEVSTTETKAIQKLARFLDGSPSEQYKCGYDGGMVFFKNGNPVLPVLFKYSLDDCRHFVFDVENKLSSSSMNNEAADFLKSLAEGKDWY